MSIQSLSQDELKRLAFLPMNSEVSGLNLLNWESYLDSMGMRRARQIQVRVKPFIDSLSNQSINLNFALWSKVGVQPWVDARQEVLGNLQSQLNIGKYSVEDNEQLLKYARLKGLIIPSLSINWLSQNKNENIVIKLLLQKLNYESLLRRFCTDFVRLKDNQGIVKLNGEWNAYSSYSGRCSARDLAMTALPNMMTDYFVAPNVGERPSVYVSFDLNQIELRLLAGFTGSSRLLNHFNTGDDVHQYFATKLFETSLVDVTPAMRKLSKSLIYATLYGAGTQRIEKIIVKSKLNVKRRPAAVLNDLYPEVMNALYEFRNSKNLYYALRKTKFQPRIGNEWLPASTKQNLPVQSATALLMKQTIVELNGKIKLVNFVHDELVCLCKKDEVIEAQHLITESVANAAGTLDFPLPMTNIISTKILGGIL